MLIILHQCPSGPPSTLPCNSRLINVHSKRATKGQRQQNWRVGLQNSSCFQVSWLFFFLLFKVSICYIFDLPPYSAQTFWSCFLSSSLLCFSDLNIMFSIYFLLYPNNYIENALSGYLTEVCVSSRIWHCHVTLFLVQELDPFPDYIQKCLIFRASLVHIIWRPIGTILIT